MRALVAREFVNHYRPVTIVGFIDDDPQKQNFHLFNYRIPGTEKIPKIVNEQRG